MATFAISMTFMVDAHDYDEAGKLGERIGNFVVQEGELANSSSLIDVEFIEDDDELEDDPDSDFQDDE